jgi:hypothetical protein
MPEWAPRLAASFGRVAVFGFNDDDDDAILDIPKGALRLAVCFGCGAGSVLDFGIEALGMPAVLPRFAACFFCADDSGVDFVTGTLDVFVV